MSRLATQAPAEARDKARKPTAPALINLRLALVGAAAAAWAATACALALGNESHLRPLTAGAVPAAAAVLFALWRKRPWNSRPWSFAWVSSVVSAILASTSAAAWLTALDAQPLAIAANQSAIAEVTAVLTGDVRVSNGLDRWGNSAGKQVVDVRVVGITVRGRSWRVRAPALLVAPASANTPDSTSASSGQLPRDPGAVVQLFARVSPGDRWRGQAAVLRAVAEPRVIREAPEWSRAATRWRDGLQQAARSSNCDASGLLPALAIGDTSAADDALTSDMRTSGLAHLSAVSGANVSIVLAVAIAIAYVVGLRRRTLALVLVAVLAWFVLLVRPSPSVVRAAAMALVMLSPMLAGVRRSPRGGDPLCLLAIATCLLLVMDPQLALSYGFALSVVATAALVVTAGPLTRWLGVHLPGKRDEELILQPTFRQRAVALGQRIRTWFIAAIAVTVCAQVAVTPLLLTMGATVSWVSLPANVLAEPAVPMATVSGLAAAAASQVSPDLAYAIARPGVWATGWIAAVAHRTANWHERSTNASWPWGSHSRFPADAVAVLCDVGQGTALVIRTAATEAVVIDAGPDAMLIDRCLRRMGVTEIPLVVLSHDHADHIGGLPGVTSGRTVGRIVMSPLDQPTAAAAWVRNQANDAQIPVTVAEAGMHITVGDVQVRVLTPRAIVAGTSSPPNDNCVSVDVEVPAGGVQSADSAADPRTHPGAARRTASAAASTAPQPIRILAPCDLEFAGQQQLLADPHLPAGDYDIALVPHHGSNRQVSEFAHWAHPRYALIPVGRDNDYGHPAPEALRLWGGLPGTSLARTDVDGDLVVVLDGTGPHLAR